MRFQATNPVMQIVQDNTRRQELARSWRDRREKDPYRFYKANLLKTPYIQVGTKDQPVATKYLVTVQNQKKITFSFKARQGEAILTGIQRNKIR